MKDSEQVLENMEAQKTNKLICMTYLKKKALNWIIEDVLANFVCWTTNESCFTVCEHCYHRQEPEQDSQLSFPTNGRGIVKLKLGFDSFNLVPGMST